MEAIPCVHCGKFFTPRNRTQNFCPETDCQRARKAAWQQHRHVQLRTAVSLADF